jgi:hypothetical protein
VLLELLHKLAAPDALALASGISEALINTAFGISGFFAWDRDVQLLFDTDRQLYI